MKFITIFLPPANEFCEGNVFRGVFMCARNREVLDLIDTVLN